MVARLAPFSDVGCGLALRPYLPLEKSLIVMVVTMMHRYKPVICTSVYAVAGGLMNKQSGDI